MGNWFAEKASDRINGAGSLELLNASFAVPDREGNLTPVISDCSFKARRGKFSVLIGPSGCGKTTLMNLMAGYLKPDRGSIEVDGHRIREPGPDRLLVFQETALFPCSSLTLSRLMPSVSPNGAVPPERTPRSSAR